MRKIFLEELPRHGKYIDWKSSIGYKVKFIYEDIEGEVEIVDYIKEDYKVKIKYNNSDFEIFTGNFIKCRLGKILNKITGEFKIRINSIFKDDKRDLIITDRRKINNYKYYKYKCNICGFDCSKHWNIKDKCSKNELWIEESNLLSGNGCSCCSGKIVVKGINDIATIEPKLVKYFTNIEDAYTHTSNSSDNILVKCPDCGEKKNIRIYTLFKNGFSCDNCSDGISYPEKVVYNLLRQLNINFIYQFGKTNSKWCNKYKYDFYFKLNNEEYIIETNGEQHYEEGFSRCGGQTLEQIQENDKNKYELAIENKIKLENYIVIDCRKSELEFIKNNIINSRLNEIFNLDNIDWIKIDKNSVISLVKEVCDYWHLHNDINNEDLSTADVSKVFNIHYATIIKYLKIGNNLTWCIYNPNEETIKGRKRNKNIKKFEMLKDGKILGVFYGIRDLAKQSENLFGIKLNNTGISQALNGKLQHYKGFEFKYVDCEIK